MWGSAAAVVEGYLLVSGGEGSETRNSLSVCNPAVVSTSFLFVQILKFGTDTCLSRISNEPTLTPGKGVGLQHK